MTATSHATPGSPGPAGQAGPLDTAALIEQLADFDGPPEQFLQQLIAAQCRVGRASGGAILKLVPGAAPEVLATSPPTIRPETAPVWLARAFEVAKGLADGSDTLDASRVQPLAPIGGGDATHLVLLPIRGDQGVRGLTAFHIALPDPRLADLARRQLELTTPLLSLYELRLSLQQRDNDMQVFASAMQTLEAINRTDRFRTAAMALVNEVAATWHAARVSVGFVSGRYVKVRAMSQTEDLSRKMQLVQDIESAMEEAFDQDAEVVHPAFENTTTINRLARKLSETHGPSAVCSLPLRHEDKPVGVLAAEFPPDRTLTADDVEALRITANLCTARLYQLSKTDRWFGARWAASTRKAAAAVIGPKHTWAKLTALAGAAVIAFAVFAKGPYRVESPFTVQTTQRHVVTSPFDGTLEAVNSEINDEVVADATVLAVLDVTDLVLERAPLVAERREYEVQADAAREEGDFAAVEIAQANYQRAQAEIALLDHRIAQAELTSPVSGVVVEGDLRQRERGQVEKGEALFEVAPLDALRAELLVPAGRIGEVRDRATHPDNPSRGQLASTAHPGVHVGFVVTVIEPEAELVNGENVFRVRVELDSPPDWLRPGVEGVAKIDVGTRRYAWMWTREAVNWVRMKLWL
ncbi:MAG: HlyD family efflux transporter periplasmic adaptor subunit [Planctomycetota bacterium]